MKIKKITLERHPGIGDIALSFSDEAGTPFNVVVLAGGNGTGKTAILDAIQKTFEGHLGGNFGVVTIDFSADADDLARMALAPLGPTVLEGPFTHFHYATILKIQVIGLHFHSVGSCHKGAMENRHQFPCWIPNGAMSFAHFSAKRT
jgi:hypothetical protein